MGVPRDKLEYVFAEEKKCLGQRFSPSNLKEEREIQSGSDHRKW